MSYVFNSYTSGKILKKIVDLQSKIWYYTLKGDDTNEKHRK